MILPLNISMAILGGSIGIIGIIIIHIPSDKLFVSLNGKFNYNNRTLVKHRKIETNKKIL
jgi:hypothetical protein